MTEYLNGVFSCIWGRPFPFRKMEKKRKCYIKLNLMSTSINFIFMTLYFSACGNSRNCMESTYVLCVSFLPISSDSCKYNVKLFYQIQCQTILSSVFFICRCNELCYTYSCMSCWWNFVTCISGMVDSLTT